MAGPSSLDLLQTYRRLFSYVRPYRWVLVPAIVATAVYALVTGLIPLFMEDVFEQLQDAALAALGNRWLQSVNCSTAAARNVSPAASTTFLPDLMKRFASLAMDVVCPTPFTPATRITVGPAEDIFSGESTSF